MDSDHPMHHPFHVEPWPRSLGTKRLAVVVVQPEAGLPAMASPIISSHDSACVHQPTRLPGVVPARGAVMVALPLAGRPLQTLI